MSSIHNLISWQYFFSFFFFLEAKLEKTKYKLKPKDIMNNTHFHASQFVLAQSEWKIIVAIYKHIT